MKIQLDILYIILYSKNMFFFTDQQQQNKHEICRANSTLWKTLIISVFVTSLQKLYGMAGPQSVFKQEWNRLYGSRHGQWLDTPSNEIDFFNMESRKSRRRNYRLLNSIRYGDSDKGLYITFLCDSLFRLPRWTSVTC